MKVLALDTSGKAVSVAVAEDGKLLADFWLSNGKTHAATLMPCISAALAGLGMQPGDFEAFAAITGPGSFTGLRIGISAVKAFAFANGAGTVGVNTLDALAMNLAGRGDALACALMDARNGNVYQAIYRICDINEIGAGVGVSDIDFAVEAAPDYEILHGGRFFAEGTIKRLAGTEMLGAGEAAERLRNALIGNPDVGRVIFTGDAAEKYIDYFWAQIYGISRNPGTSTRIPARFVMAAGRALCQSASAAALLACEAAARGELAAPDRLMPQYYNEGYIKPRGQILKDAR